MKLAAFVSGSAAVLVLAASLCASCADLKRAEEPAEAGGIDAATVDGATSTDGSLAADAADAAFPPGKGPGPHGSLPTGYCCTSDKECRYRHCVDTGSGGRMCLDECEKDKFCTRPDITFTCDANAGASPRLCKPSTGFTCLPAAGFTRGTKELGACCNVPVADPDGTAELECEGAVCARSGAAPLVCTQRCDVQMDCEGQYGCNLLGSTTACVPGSTDYTCF